MSALREYLAELDLEVLLLEPPEMDAAVVGLVERCGMEPVVCYDRSKVIALLMANDGMDEEEAEEFFDFNIGGAYLGEATPMFLSPIVLH